MAGINTYGNTVGGNPQTQALTSKMGVKSPISLPKAKAPGLSDIQASWGAPKSNPGTAANPYGISLDTSPINKTPAKAPAQSSGFSPSSIAAKNAIGVRSLYGQTSDKKADLAYPGAGGGAVKSTNSTTGLLGGVQNPTGTATSSEPGSLNLNPKPIATPATPYPNAESGSFAGNLNAVAGASNLGNNQSYNDQYNNASKSLNKLYAGQENAAVAPYAGAQNNLSDQASKELGTSYTDIFRPQSTGNLAGEMGLLNTQFSQGINANTRAQQYALAEQQLGQSGASTIAGLTGPGQRGYGSTLFNPATGQDIGGGASGGGAFGGGQELGNLALGQQFQQTILPAYNAAGGIKNDLVSYLNSNPNLNPSNFNYANAKLAWLQGGQFSDPRYPILSQKLTEFLNTLSPVAGAPGDVTNFKQELVNNMLNAASNGASLAQQIESLYSLAGRKVQAIKDTGTSGNTSAGSTGTGSIYDF